MFFLNDVFFLDKYIHKTVTTQITILVQSIDEEMNPFAQLENESVTRCAAQKHHLVGRVG